MPVNEEDNGDMREVLHHCFWSARTFFVLLIKNRKAPQRMMMTDCCFPSRDSWGRRCCSIVAIDANIFRCYTDQFEDGLLKRELDKVRWMALFARQ